MDRWPGDATVASSTPAGKAKWEGMEQRKVIHSSFTSFILFAHYGQFTSSSSSSICLEHVHPLPDRTIGHTGADDETNTPTR